MQQSRTTYKKGFMPLFLGDGVSNTVLHLLLPPSTALLQMGGGSAAYVGPPGALVGAPGALLLPQRVSEEVWTQKIRREWPTWRAAPEL